MVAEKSGILALSDLVFANGRLHDPDLNFFSDRLRLSRLYLVFNINFNMVDLGCANGLRLLSTVRYA